VFRLIKGAISLPERCDFMSSRQNNNNVILYNLRYILGGKNSSYYIGFKLLGT
jgi:hypothetical protein